MMYLRRSLGLIEWRAFHSQEYAYVQPDTPRELYNALQNNETKS